VGGYAVAMHGRPRHTGDLDVWVRRSPENSAKLTGVMREFGFGALGLEEADFLNREQVVQLGDPPFRIDLLTDIDGVEFGTAWPGRESLTYDGLTLIVIGLDDLKKTSLRQVGGVTWTTWTTFPEPPGLPHRWHGAAHAPPQGARTSARATRRHAKSAV
jgi:hypothetical protein